MGCICVKSVEGLNSGTMSVRNAVVSADEASKQQLGQDILEAGSVQLTDVQMNASRSLDEIQDHNTLSGTANVTAIGKDAPEYEGRSPDSGWLESYPVSDEINFDEDQDDDEIFQRFFGSLPESPPGRVQVTDIGDALAKLGAGSEQAELVDALKAAVAQKQGRSGDVDYSSFKSACAEVPRAGGRRVQWAQGLGLHLALASLLPAGDLLDELRGLRELPEERLGGLLRAFCARVPALVARGLRDLRAARPPAAAVGELLGSKFAGAPEGRFATLDDFHRGLEAALGSPNPRVLEGMEREHCQRPNCRTRFRTPNYNVETYPALEWEFVVAPAPGRAYPHTPAVADPGEWRGADALGNERREWRGHGREPAALDALAGLEDARRAGLGRGEVVALRLYTGPLYVLYNAALRGFPAHHAACLLGNRCGAVPDAARDSDAGSRGPRRGACVAAAYARRAPRRARRRARLGARRA